MLLMKQYSDQYTQKQPKKAFNIEITIALIGAQSIHAYFCKTDGSL